MPAVGAGITDQFVTFVKRLRGIERLLRAEPEQAVGMPLQFGKVVKRRRTHAPRLRFHRFDGRLTGLRARDDLRGLKAIGVEAGGFLNFAYVANPGTLIRFGFRLARGPEGRHDFDVVFRHETADRQFALDHHRQCGGLHAAYAQLIPKRQRVGTREIHSHKPVGTAPAARGFGQRIVVRARTQLVETFANGFGGQGRNPQTADGLNAPRRFINVTENQFAFAPGVSCTDDAGDARRHQNLPHRLVLVFGLLVSDQRPVVGQHGQKIAPPRSPLGPDLMRLGERGEVADGPRHHVSVAMQISVAAGCSPQNLRDIARDGRFLGENSDGGAQTTSVVTLLLFLSRRLLNNSHNLRHQIAHLGLRNRHDPFRSQRHLLQKAASGRRFVKRQHSIDLLVAVKLTVDLDVFVPHLRKGHARLDEFHHLALHFLGLSQLFGRRLRHLGFHL